MQIGYLWGGSENVFEELIKKLLQTIITSICQIIFCSLMQLEHFYLLKNRKNMLQTKVSSSFLYHQLDIKHIMHIKM